MLKSKRAQTGETITWIVATIVIIGILLIFTLVSSIFAKENGMVVSFSRVFSSDDLTDTNWIKAKTDLALKINDNNKNKIEQWIKGEGEQDSYEIDMMYTVAG
jgi:hypothetical protein